MPLSRRDFLKISGIAIAGLLVSKPILDSVTKSSVAADSKTGILSMSKVTNNTAIPVAKKRLAIAFDINACKAKDGCRVCIDTCNNLHNIPTFNDPKDEIKWIWTTSFKSAFEQESLDTNIGALPVIVMCNQCDNPPCVRVCPTQATFKREDGVVVVDEHRCIGCRYCMAACPYGSRSFNWRDPRPFIKNINPDFPTRTRGVVEKCDMCMERLALGQNPACIDFCPYKALYFGDINDSQSEIRKILGSRYSMQRKPELGTKPQVYYLV